ncbi:high-affinity nicotinic acid transporter-like protein [Clavulina sp. PMI_390]|nr:high-affinity nicotinic acid transporter-like protein [Clavulina sp. PMI_390]
MNSFEIRSSYKYNRGLLVITPPTRSTPSLPFPRDRCHFLEPPSTSFLMSATDEKRSSSPMSGPDIESTKITVEGKDPRWDAAFEQRVVRKMDLHIVPIVMALYLLSFLDRVNIGNARLYGLQADLNMSNTQYEVALSIFFVTYLAFEVPSNLVLKKFTPHRWMATLAVSWSIIASLTGLCHTYHQFIACRVLLGVFEAGLFPGLAMYLTFFYTKRELSLRIGYLFVSAALAGACGGLLAFAIGHLAGTDGLKGWRWIMFIEGIPTFVAGIITWFFLADGPENAGYLSAEEKEFLRVRRLKEQGETANAQEFHWEDVRKAFTDWRVIAFAAAQFGVDTMLYGYSTFLPTIIQEIGNWSSATVQVMTIPCYALGAITYLSVAWFADRTGRRASFIIFFTVIAMIGYIILLSTATPGADYFACFLCAMGLYVIVGLPYSWLPANTPRYGKRTTANGLQLTVGNSSGVMVPFIYTKKPRFTKGHAITLAMLGVALVIHSILWISYHIANRRRAEGKEDYKTEGMTDEQVEEMGDESPRFVYTE